ncbi:histidine kinase [Massilia oculi]|uniref:histidine kinase n=1 Tax=Massilia oculi TaxID=945844 RepID=A0A2S2DPJ1_9BURK|nr:GAF domain-containing sensor histidine kinase [Massilia oculi]AWL07251.1 histidine kinase [Massilia oculi]
MTSSPATLDEEARLAVLDSYGILDTPPERSFDDVVRLVSQLLSAPIAAVNLIARGRQWFKSEIGLGVREMPLDDSICRFALLEEQQMIVPDTREDPRFRCNPLVTRDAGLRFYAGAQLRTRDGVALGTLCVLDHKPRPQGLSEQEQFVLATLAHQIMSQIELRKAMAEQEALIAALRQSDQRKDEFLAMLAHELRNPLAPIVSAATMLSNFNLDPAMVQRASEIVARQAGHMTSLIDDLLDVSRVTRGKVELELRELDFKDVIADAIEQVRPLIEKHQHRLTLDLPPARAIVVGDRKRLVQVMTNLLSNAAKYTLEGGRIEVRLTTDGAALAVDIRDDGIGMSPELIASAFDLFAQGARAWTAARAGWASGWRWCAACSSCMGARSAPAATALAWAAPSTSACRCRPAPRSSGARATVTRRRASCRRCASAWSTTTRTRRSRCRCCSKPWATRCWSRIPRAKRSRRCRPSARTSACSISACPR